MLIIIAIKYRPITDEYIPYLNFVKGNKENHEKSLR